MSNWFQDGAPESYKIKILYNEVPAFVKTRLLDTPFRFSSYEDAQTLGQEMFNGVQYRIVGSSDKPHWQSTPIEKVLPEGLKKKAWYDIYGVATAKQKQQSPQLKQTPQARQAMEALSKLKPLKVSGSGVSKIEK